MINKIMNSIKSISVFNVFVSILIIGLLYGGMSLYLKYTGFSKFMNKTRIIAVKAIPVKIDIAQNTYRALSVIESLDSIDVTSKVNGLLDKVHYKESSLVNEGDLLFSIISSDSIGLTKIYAGVDPKNIASGRAFLKAGFEFVCRETGSSLIFGNTKHRGVFLAYPNSQN